MPHAQTRAAAAAAAVDGDAGGDTRMDRSRKMSGPELRARLLHLLFLCRGQSVAFRMLAATRVSRGLRRLMAPTSSTYGGSFFVRGGEGCYSWLTCCLFVEGNQADG